MKKGSPCHHNDSDGPGGMKKSKSLSLREIAPIDRDALADATRRASAPPACRAIAHARARPAA